MTWTYEHTFNLDATPERVFQALTEPEELTWWFAEEVQVEPRAGGRYHFWGRHTLAAPSRAEADQTLLRFEPGRALEFSWRLHGVGSRVALELAPDGESKSKLRVAQSFPAELPIQRPRELIDDYWRLVHGNLTAHLAGGGGIVRPDFTDPAPEVRLSIRIEAPPAAVFRALLEPDAVNRWFGGAPAEVEPVAGGRYRLNWKYQVDGRDVTGGPTRILELVPNRKLVIDWLDWRGDLSVTGQTITFLLEPTGDATTVTLVHGGFTRAADLSDYPFGWVWFLEQLTAEVGRGRS